MGTEPGGMKITEASQGEIVCSPDPADVKSSCGLKEQIGKKKKK